MRKYGFVTVLVLLCLLLCSCVKPATTYTNQPETYEYSIGEQVQIFDKESKAELGNITVTGVYVLKDEAFTLQEYDYDENGNQIYKQVEYDAVIQIDYTYAVIDSSQKISGNNFTVKDCEGNSARHNPDTIYKQVETNNETIIVAVKEKGEFINIDFSFHKNQESIAKIKAYYDAKQSNSESQNTSQDDFKDDIEEENKNKNITKGFNTILVVVCCVLVVWNVALTVVLIIVLIKRKNKSN